MQIKINIERLWQNLETLATFTIEGQPWTRRAFTPMHAKGREWIAEQMKLAGLEVSIDIAGNMIGKRLGGHPELKSIVTGSHSDTVVNGGRYDGIIGVMAGIEVAHSLFEQGIKLQHSFEVIDFLSEEPSDYGVSCVGSRALTGVLTEQMLACENQDGETLRQAMTRVGAKPEGLTKPLREAGSIEAFVELHIEQGPVLELKEIPVGVVTNIVGIHRVGVTLHGQANHAGTTPMDMRRDALVGASRIVEAVYQSALAQNGNPHYVVGTVGYLTVTPNAANAVPGEAELILEVRSDSNEILSTFIGEVLAQVSSGIGDLGLKIEVRQLSRSEPVDCQKGIIQTIEQATRELNLEFITMPSGAGHDAAYISAIAPVGMIFIPCKDGVSHNPDECITQTDMENGVRMLMQTIILLDQR